MAKYRGIYMKRCIFWTCQRAKDRIVILIEEG